MYTLYYEMVEYLDLKLDHSDSIFDDKVNKLIFIFAKRLVTYTSLNTSFS